MNSYLVAALGVSIAITLVGAHLSSNSHRYDAAGAVSAVIGTLLIIVMLLVNMTWYRADVKRKILNDTYGTTYTTEQVFFASDVLEVIREIQRKRIELRVSEQE